MALRLYRCAQSVRCLSTGRLIRAETTPKDAVSQLLSDLDASSARKAQKEKDTRANASDSQPTSTAETVAKSTQPTTASTLPGSRPMRSDTASVYFRDTDADKFKITENKYHLHCLTSHSNTLLTLTNYKHEVVMWTSAGLCGFKKSARGGYEAGFRSIVMMLDKMKQKEDEDAALELKLRTNPQRVQKVSAKKQKLPFRPASIEVIIKEFGQGRDAIQKALMGVEGEHYRNRITKLIDATPLKFGGVRSRAMRRL